MLGTHRVSKKVMIRAFTNFINLLAYIGADVGEQMSFFKISKFISVITEDLKCKC